jgi:S-disulfanyl-L-cysteine oxidoreductase SoxD
LDKCSACPSGRGEGRDPLGPQLVGGIGTLGSENPIFTLGSYWPYSTSVWDYIHRAMPYSQPGTLSVDDTYAVTAYLLYLNGIISEDQMLNRETLPEIRMPNRDGFLPDPRPDVGGTAD